MFLSEQCQSFAYFHFCDRLSDEISISSDGNGTQTQLVCACVQRECYIYVNVNIYMRDFVCVHIFFGGREVFV